MTRHSIIKRATFSLFLALSPVCLLAQAIPQQDRSALLMATPDIAGIRDGQFLEPVPLELSNHSGYVSMLNGRTLEGWDGMPGVWRVEDGAIVCVSTAEKNAGNTFIVFKPIRSHDFDLKFEVKVEQGAAACNTGAVQGFCLVVPPLQEKFRSTLTGS